ncbi:MAG: helix-turn-helix transcriptional regulator [Streptosporangiaceae bacterium]
MTTPTYIPSVRARRVARILRDLRDQAKMSQTAVAGRFGWSQQKVGAIESARNKVSEHDAALLLDLFGVTSPDREATLALVREADQRNWWTDYVGVLSGPYVALEDAADQILNWAPLVIPGLLQTTDYAREIISAGRPGASTDLDQRLRARLARQTVLVRDQDPPNLHVVLDEAVIRRPIGGPDVIRAQLRRLLSEIDRTNVTIQVLPFNAGTHSGLDGSVIVLKFAEPLDPDVAFVEGMMGGVYLENPHQVTRCSLAFERLTEAALTPHDSAALIEAAAKK